MNIPVSPDSLLRFAAALAAFLIARTAWQRREAPGARTFSLMMLAAGWWSLFAGLEYASHSVAMRVLWAKFEYFGITSLPALWLLFTLQYSQRTRSRLQVAVNTPLLFAIPAVCLLLALSNEWHGLIWTSVTPFTNTSGEISFVFAHGIAFWVMFLYSQLLLLVGTLALTIAAVRFPALYRKQAAALITGALIPWLANVSYVLGINPLIKTDLTPVAFVLAGVVFAIGAFRFYLFDVVPVAQDSVIESMRDGIIVLDARGRIAYHNPTAARMFITNPDGSEPLVDWVGKTPAQIFRAYPEILARLEQPGSMREEIGCIGEKRICIELGVSEVTGPRGEADGRLITLRDITQRKQYEEQLLLQSVALQSAANGIVITDQDGRVQWVNPAFSRITGYSLDEMSGQLPNQLKSGKHGPEFYQQLWETIKQGQIWSGELINRRKDGTLYNEEQTIAPVRDASGQITHFIGIKQDITQRKNLENMRDDLMKSLVHDLRNPLNSIMMALEMVNILQQSEMLPVDIEQMIQISRDNTQRMMGMVNAILDIGRLESGEVSLQREPLVMAQLVEEACNLQSPLASRNEILLLNGVDYNLPQAQGDPGLISRTMQNLIDNAIKFTPPGGVIEISAAYDEAQQALVMRVRDSGDGVPEELLPRIFDKYIVGSSARRGAGLGLAFCRLAVEAHGGKIWVESAPQQGTIFAFTLPATPEPPTLINLKQTQTKLA